MPDGYERFKIRLPRTALDCSFIPCRVSWRKWVFTELSLGREWAGVDSRSLAADLASLAGTAEASVPTWFGGGTGNVEDRRDGCVGGNCRPEPEYERHY